MDTLENASSMRLFPQLSDIAEQTFLYVIEAGYIEAEKIFQPIVREHNSYLLFFVFGGVGKLVYDGTEYEFEKGSMAILDDKKDFRIHTADPKRWRYFYLYFNGRQAPAYYNLYSSLKSPLVQFNQNTMISSLLWQIIALHKEKNMYAEIITSLDITKLLTEACLTGNYFTEKKDYPEYVKKTFHYIEHQYMQKITLNLIAKRLSISRSHLSREFKRYTGMTVNDCIVKTRLKNAKTLLRHTDKPIGEIALESGFCSASHFISAFSKKEHTTPQLYRNQWLK